MSSKGNVASVPSCHDLAFLSPTMDAFRLHLSRTTAAVTAPAHRQLCVELESALETLSSSKVGADSLSSRPRLTSALRLRVAPARLSWSCRTSACSSRVSSNQSFPRSQIVSSLSSLLRSRMQLQSSRTFGLVQ
jgi:hypothetical protein